MAGYVRLQSLLTLSAGDTTQRLEEAIDLGDYSEVTVQVRKPVAASGISYLYLQQVFVFIEEVFVDVATVSLATDTTNTVRLTQPLRYLRWRATVSGTDPSFQIDLIGREG